MPEPTTQLDEKTKAELKAKLDSIISRLDEQIKTLEINKKKSEMIISA